MAKRRFNRRQVAKAPAGAARQSLPASVKISHGTALALAALVLVGGAVWWIYGGALHAPFVFDDYDSVLGNPSIVRLWPLVGNAESPGPLNPPKDFVTAGRPLVNLSLALNYRFGRLNPIGYHVLNVAMHLLSALVLCAIVRRTLRLGVFGGTFDRAAEPLALAVALVWAVHPLQTETVEYITQRSELVVGFCYLATLYSSLRYWGARSQSARFAWLAVATAACLAGMASKEVMVSAPVLVLLFERTFVAASFRGALRKSWPLYVGLTCGWLLLWALNSSGPRAGTAGFHLGVPAHVWWFTQTKVLLVYLKLALWPWPLVIHYELPYLESLRAAWPWLLPVAAWALLTLLLLWRRTAVGFLSACVFLILSPTLVVPILTEVAAERRMYLPLAALVALAVVGSYALADRLTRGRASSAAGAPALARWPIAAAIVPALALAVVFSVLSVRRLAMYNDAITLWQDAAAHQPDSYIVQNNLGLELAHAGRRREAIEQYELALASKPDFAQARLNLGVELLAAGRIEEAIEQDREALRSRPDFPEAHYNLGVSLHKSGRVQEARACYERALALRPEYADAHTNLGAILNAEGRSQDAIAHFARALRQKPDYVEAYANLAVVFARLGRESEALAAAQNAIDLARAQGQPALADEIAAWMESYRASISQGQPGDDSR